MTGNRLQRKIQIRDKTLSLGERTVIMGILNVTPDSFSDGGRFNALSSGLEQAARMVAEGADIIDVGGESTRPGHVPVPEEEEILRILPFVKEILGSLDTMVSIDTYKSRTARRALEAGAHIINDVWGFHRDWEMARVAGEFQVPVVLMHNQEGTHYDRDIIAAMKIFFDEAIEAGLKAGIKEEHIILDPGIGFGKNPQQNVTVMHRLHEIKAFGYPVLLGTSRKSMIGKILDLPVAERLEGTLGSNAFGLMAGCEILRVHDVKAHSRMARVMDTLIKGELDG
ncbi:MAG: dihydropteroate synthase [delta proteobacterium ML8_F1]|nr:MAG: dihydropteroate synthase [delta proteobacterium ML8_F1]